MRENADLIVKRPNGQEFGYVLQTPSVSLSTSMYSTNQATIEHLKSPPNVPMNVGMATPTQPGGQYDVRDSDGDKAITHLDWSGGAGQKSLDNDYSSASRFASSRNVETQVKGQLSLARQLTFNQVQNATGPVFAALGKYWMACVGGKVKYSSDGITWTEAVLSNNTNGPINGFCSDGSYVYFCVGTGSYPGVWKSNNNNPVEFTRISVAEAVDITYCAGMLYVATATGAGHLNPATMVYVQDTFSFLANNLTVGIVTVDNVVYWVASQGGTTYVYSITYNPDTAVFSPAEVTHLRAGFIGTCVESYLDGLYIGGYMGARSNTVGQGAIYLLQGGVTFPLVRIGPDAAENPDMSDLELDQRIWALCPGWDKMYIQCTRAIYVWDIEDGGYHHVQDFYSPTVGSILGGNPQYDAFEGGAFQISAFQASETYNESVSFPGLAFQNGNLLAPYQVLSSTIADVAFTNSAANPSVFTTVNNHNLNIGQHITISGSTSTPSCTGSWFVNSTPTTKTFTIKSVLTGVPWEATVQGTGTYTLIPTRGAAVLSNAYAPVGDLTTSISNFHTGSMQKDFYQITVTHDQLTAGENITMAYMIDNGSWVGAQKWEEHPTYTVFRVQEQGYAIAVRPALIGPTTTTPVIRSINVVWNFAPVMRHTYQLDCRAGAAEGRWQEHPESAIRHIYAAANEHSEYEDRFSGPYFGIIEKLAFQQAGFSAKEGMSGLVTITVREIG